jgi:hypothetical protein
MYLYGEASCPDARHTKTKPRPTQNGAKTKDRRKKSERKGNEKRTRSGKTVL